MSGFQQDKDVCLFNHLYGTYGHMCMSLLELGFGFKSCKVSRKRWREIPNKGEKVDAVVLKWFEVEAPGQK